jgi:hypothetical protein
MPAHKKSEAGKVEALVRVTVTKFGDGKVSTGSHVAETGDAMAAKGTILAVDLPTATALEARGLAEIVDE